MELQQLRYVVAVAETGNFTRAAERCFVSQPSLSQQVINLEAELGQKLFHRLGRRAIPTEAGQAFLDRARQILADVETASRQFRDDPAFDRKIVVGMIPTLAPYLLPPLLQKCAQEHPNLMIHTREDFRLPLCRAVIDGELDLALVSLPVTDPHLAIEPIFTERLVLAVGRAHPLARKSEVSAADLPEQTFILMGESSTLTSQIQRFCGDHNFEPKIGYRCSQIRTVKALAALGFGIAILPQVARSADDRDLVYKELTARAPTREIAIVRHMQRYQSRGVEAFASTLRLAVRSYHWGTPLGAAAKSGRTTLPTKEGAGAQPKVNPAKPVIIAPADANVPGTE
jgi:LysR family transcriptional regulator, hydrogen peroxide-inducible genes activator